MKLNTRLMKNAGLVALGGAITLSGLQAINIATGGSNAATYKRLNLFGEVYDRVRSDYVEKPDEQKMMEAALNGMLASLDRHSSYMNAKDFAEMNIKTKGEFGGLGIEVTMENGVIKVVAPYD